MHFPQRYLNRKREWVFFSKHSVVIKNVTTVETDKKNSKIQHVTQSE